MTFDAFDTITIQTSRTSVFARCGGSGPPVLLLHGFPETHLMWRTVAPRLARNFTVVRPDLPGYGRSGCPASAPGHAPYAKRAIARELAEVMEQLGFTRFGLAGHDRGGRTAASVAPLGGRRSRRHRPGGALLPRGASGPDRRTAAPVPQLRDVAGRASGREGFGQEGADGGERALVGEPVVGHAWHRAGHGVLVGEAVLGPAVHDQLPVGLGVVHLRGER